jgi:hypothetical protein
VSELDRTTNDHIPTNIRKIAADDIKRHKNGVPATPDEIEEYVKAAADAQRKMSGRGLFDYIRNTSKTLYNGRKGFSPKA